MPITVPLYSPQDCPVVGHTVVLSRDRTLLDYVIISESTPTCSNLHACLSQYGDIKNIPECLLHSPSKYFPVDDK